MRYILYIYIRDTQKQRRTDMTFLALGIESSLLMQQKDQLEYEEMVYVGDYNEITSELGNAQGATNPNDRLIAQLEAQQQLYDSYKSSIETQLKVVNAEIDSYGKATDTNIKSECKLSVSV